MKRFVKGSSASSAIRCRAPGIILDNSSAPPTCVISNLTMWCAGGCSNAVRSLRSFGWERSMKLLTIYYENTFMDVVGGYVDRAAGKTCE